MGVAGIYRIDDQSVQMYRSLLTDIPTTGSAIGAEVNWAFGMDRGVELPPREKILKNSVWLTHYLSTGQHLTQLQQQRAKALQKSVLATYYLGEKTIDITSTIQLDTKLLSQINNALSVDLFQYLNQSVNRSDSLDEYLDLLKALLDRADQRIIDLQYKVDFLTANVQAKEQELKMSEDAFFENLKIFDGPNAEEQLGQFIGLRESQVEIRAKLGSYITLRDYYTFFKPRLESLIGVIKVNRDPLIAGVKVVEVQNMSLPLIIRQR